MARLVPWEDNYTKSREELINMIEIMNERQKASGNVAHNQFLKIEDLEKRMHARDQELQKHIRAQEQELDRLRPALARQLTLYAAVVTERADVQERLDKIIELDRTLRALRDRLDAIRAANNRLVMLVKSKATRRELREQARYES